jgi:hypothetical protein
VTGGDIGHRVENFMYGPDQFTEGTMNLLGFFLFLCFSLRR